jgi:hypothetical protein
METIEILGKQGLKATKGPGPNSVAAYYITDLEDGRQYILTYDEVEDLRRRGKLDIRGIREHDEQVGKRGGWPTSA